MSKKRKLISEDKSYLDLLERDLSGFIPRLKDLKEEFEALEIKPFSNTILTELLNEGAAKTESQFETKLQTQLKKAGITSLVIQENMMAGSKERFNEFRDALEFAKDFIPTRSSMDSRKRLNIDSISFDGECFLITDEEKERLLEENARIYLETEEEFKLYANLENLLTAYNSLTQNLEELKYDAANNSAVSLPSGFFTLKDGKYQIKAISIKHAVNFHSWKEEMRAERQAWRERRNNPKTQ